MYDLYLPGLRPNLFNDAKRGKNMTVLYVLICILMCGLRYDVWVEV